MSTVIAEPIADEAAEKLQSDRLKWRSMLDTLPFVEVEVKSAQMARKAAHDEWEAAKVRHGNDVAMSHTAERAGEYSLRCIEEARLKLLNSAPEAIAKRIKLITKQLQELRFDKGADLIKQAQFSVDKAEEDYFNTKNGDQLNILDRAKHRLGKIQYEVADLTGQLDKAIGEALFID